MVVGTWSLTQRVLEMTCGRKNQLEVEAGVVAVVVEEEDEDDEDDEDEVSPVEGLVVAESELDEESPPDDDADDELEDVFPRLSVL